MSQEKKYEVALSYSSENRDYVEEVAVILNLSEVAVFYDRFEEIDLWGKNLYEHLQQVYRDLASYTVIFCSESYANKAWTRHEHRSAQERAMLECREYILPARFDNSMIPGLSETTAYLNLQTMQPYGFTQRLCRKMGKPIINKLAYDLTKIQCPFRTFCDLEDFKDMWCYDSCKQLYGWNCNNCGAEYVEHVPDLSFEVKGIRMTKPPHRQADTSRLVKRHSSGFYPGIYQGLFQNHNRDHRTIYSIPKSDPDPSE